MSLFENDHLKEVLSKRAASGHLRSLNDYASKIDFLSNDYLGLASTNSELLTKSGSGGSRLISGNSSRYQEAEQELASFFAYPRALFFPSGYLANLSVFSTLPQKGDLVLYDKAIHASVRDGLRLGHADSIGFRHNDMLHLETLLETHQNRTIFVVVESLYSMHGDLAPLTEINSLCLKFNAALIVDEAHSGGLFGEVGRGLTNHFGIDEQVFIKIITFGKAYGSFGSLVLCQPFIHEYLINYARPFIYSTAMPDSHVVYLSGVVKLDELKRKRDELFENIEVFTKGVEQDLLISSAHSPIQIIRNTPEELKRIEHALLEAGLAAKLILPPTVSKGEECLRVCIHSFNTREEIDLLCSVIQKSHSID